MSDSWKINNIFTGEEESLFQPRYDEPTQAWVEGWECYMHNGLSTNPYELGSSEAGDWQDGHDSAERD